MPQLTDLAQQAIANVLRPGGTAIDATAGNGHDTLFLAKTVGPKGCVYAFDIQPEAIEQTRRLLDANEISNVNLFQASHELMLDTIGKSATQNVQAIMFNLGYLPGGDHSITTTVETTMVAIESATSLLAPNSVMTILVYIGHAGGPDELTAIQHFVDSLPESEFIIEHHAGPSRTSPQLFVVCRQLS